MHRRIGLTVAAFAVVATMVAGCSAGESTGFERDSTDPADALTETKCSMCHNTERIYSADKSRDEWDTTMKRMKANGMVITDAEYAQILEYLGK